MLRLVYVGGLGMMAGPAAIHLTPAETAQVLRVHDRGKPGRQRDRFRSVWQEHGAELVPDFDQLIGDGEIDGVVVCAGKNGDDLPLIVQKSDGGYLYATTDLAAIRYRVAQQHADG